MMLRHKQHPLTSPQALLEVGLRFTEGDLQANREGALSDNQRQRLANRTREVKLFAAILIVGFAVLSALMVALGEWHPLIVVAWIVTPILIGYFSLQSIGYLRDAAKGRVLIVEGKVELNTIRVRAGRGGSVTYYIVGIERIGFRVTRTVFNAFVDGLPYRIYYAPRSKVILAAELLENV